MPNIEKQVMLNKQDINIFGEIIKKYHITQETASFMEYAITRIDSIDESKTFRYVPVAEFEKKIQRLNTLKERATKAFEPFAKRYATSLCAAMGIPMSKAISSSKKTGNYDAIYELFGLTNAKAKRFGLAALYCALEGQKTDIGHEYNIVFDRDSPWTYRNEAEHMEEYARYHFNSYMINHVQDIASNPFDSVMELYEFGIADFIFMQTEQDGVKKERLGTFHTVNIPDKGNVIAVHMTGDKSIFHYRRWGDPYFRIKPVKEDTGLHITGIADQRFRTG
jgi:hypothetical protein